MLSNQKIRCRKEMKRPVPILQIEDEAVDTKAKGVQEM